MCEDIVSVIHNVYTQEGLSQLQELMCEDAPEPTATTSTEGSKKRKRKGTKRGDRGSNKFPDDIYVISAVAPNGQPLAPEEALPKYRNAIGFLVRDILDISIKRWSSVPEDDRKEIWRRMGLVFRFPPNSEEMVKEFTLKQCAISFRNWRSEMNTKYAKTGKDPTKKTKITEGQWAVFLEQRQDPEFKALSEANSLLAKKNKYHHRLGTGGYQRQVPKWRAEDAAKKAAGLPVLSELVGERPANWMRARKPNETETGLSFDDPMVEEASRSILAVAAKQREGNFKPRREKDVLTVALGNPEHPGRVRGISSKEGWKDGFGPEWEGEYRRRDRYKEEMASYFKEEAKKDFQEMMGKMLQNPPPELLQKLASAVASNQQISSQAPQMQLVPVVTQPMECPGNI